MVSTRRSSFSVPSLPTESVGSALVSCPHSNPIKPTQQGMSSLPPLPKSRRNKKNYVVTKKRKIAGEKEVISSINFLRDVNPDSCIDLLSIPDPPSPSKKKNRRRTLTAPLTDRTNDNNSSHQHAKRSRRSLAQIPLPKSSPLLESSSTNTGGTSRSENQRGKGLERDEKIRNSDLIESTSDHSSFKSGPEQRSARRRKTMHRIPAANLDAADKLLGDDSQSDTDMKKKQKEEVEMKKLDLLGAIEYESEAVPEFVRRRESRKSMYSGPIEISTHKVGSEIINNENQIRLEVDQCREDSDANMDSEHFKQTECQENFPQPSNMPEGTDYGAVPSELKAGAEKQQLNSTELCDDDFTKDNTEDFVGTRRRKRHSLDLHLIKDAQLEFENGSSGNKTPDLSQSNLMDEEVSKKTSTLETQPAQKGPKSVHQCKDSDTCDDGGNNKVTAYFENLVKYGANIQHHGKAKTKKARSSNYEDAGREEIEDETMKIRKLVRRYCSLSESERAESDEAKEIKNMTEYPMHTKKNRGDEDEISGQNPYEKQRVLFAKLVPIVERMEQSKVDERALYEEMTGYRAEKSRGKRYRYFSLSDNVRIPPHDYQKIYTEVQQKLTFERSSGIAKFLKKHEPVPSATTLPKRAITQAKSSVGINKEAKGVINVEELPFESSSIDDDIKDNSISTQESDGKVGRQLVLPLPARNEIPSNPDIRLAHKELWEKIDFALESYSRTVLAIQATKKVEENKRID